MANTGKNSTEGEFLSLTVELNEVYIDEPNYNQLREDRAKRTHQAMKAADAFLADCLLLQERGPGGGQQAAAVCLQKYWRGQAGRKRYLEKLLEKFEQEEKLLQQKMQQQVEEGELLVDNHKLLVLLDEDTTVRRNRDRHQLCQVITIQRAWRAYLQRKAFQGTSRVLTDAVCQPEVGRHVTFSDRLVPESRQVVAAVGVKERSDRKINSDDGESDENDDRDEDDCENSETESVSGGQTMTLSTPEENQEVQVAAADEQQPQQQHRLTQESTPLTSSCLSAAGSEAGSAAGSEAGSEAGLLGVKLPAVVKSLQDSECESVVSDYSELGGPLKELEKELELIDREELRRNTDSPFLRWRGRAAASGSGAAAGQQGVDLAAYAADRQAGESDEEYSRRVRKFNFLSLAQEFAELKKINADACPIDFHLSQSQATSGRPTVGKRNSLSEADQRLEAEDHPSAMADAQKLDPRLPDVDKGGNCAERRSVSPDARGRESVVVMRRDRSARRGGAGRREGSAKRNSHQGTPQREVMLPSADVPERPLSQPLDGDFEVFTMETSVPAMNWELLEQQLQLAAQEERNRQEARQTDREEIRRKLAMGTDEEYYGGERAFKKPSLSARLQGGMNLQICFMNDAAAAVTPDDGDVTPTAATATTHAFASSSQSYHNLSAASPAAGSKVKSQALRSPDMRMSKNRPLSDPGILAAQLSLPPSTQENESLLERQQRLQQEAKIALAQASNMARMQLEVERQTKKKSPIADIVGLPELGDGRTIKLSRKVLQEMNLAQLQVLVNDLHTQIESLNEELVHLLIERDDLHMEQDSMLVDIEDLTSFAQHMSETNNNKASLNNRNSAWSHSKHFN